MNIAQKSKKILVEKTRNFLLFGNNDDIIWLLANCTMFLIGEWKREDRLCLAEFFKMWYSN